MEAFIWRGEGGMGGWPAVPSTVPALWPCRVMGQAGGPCTALAFVSCRHGHGSCRAVPSGPWAMPKGHAACRAASPWAVWKSIALGAAVLLVREKNGLCEPERSQIGSICRICQPFNNTFHSSQQIAWFIR